MNITVKWNTFTAPNRFLHNTLQSSFQSNENLQILFQWTQYSSVSGSEFNLEPKTSTVLHHNMAIKLRGSYNYHGLSINIFSNSRFTNKTHDVLIFHFVYIPMKYFFNIQVLFHHLNGGHNIMLWLTLKYCGPENAYRLQLHQNPRK